MKDKILDVLSNLKIEIEKESDYESLLEFGYLAMLLYSKEWPEAVNNNLICDPSSDTEKKERGEGIIELMIEEDLKGLKVLDYGCGEGHCALVSFDYKTQKSVGYDIKEHESWKSFKTQDKIILTTDLPTVMKHVPYDVIILFDVLDHVKNQDPKDLLVDVKNLLSENGKIYMRCHPWTSRHATHLYHTINKAYLHMVFTDEELKQLVPYAKYEEDNIGVRYPLITYGKYIEESGLYVVSKRTVTEVVEPFFQNSIISKRIVKKSKMKDNIYPEFQMTLQFIDYVLAKVK